MEKTKQIKKYLLDANIYGEMVVDKEIEELRENFEVLRKVILVYGINSVIRKELRNTPKKIKVEGKNLRNYLLMLYDNFTEGHEIKIFSDTESIVNTYYKTYRELGGSKSKNELYNDFIIVACASKNGMDIIVSQDEKSMRTENAIRSYKIVNEANKLRTPEFIEYKTFKSILRGKSDKFVSSSNKFWILLLFFNLFYKLIKINFFPFHKYLLFIPLFKSFAQGVRK